jgi:peptidoglycan hydrolase-like protein with peptidoglycan-binding domain
MQQGDGLTDNLYLKYAVPWSRRHTEDEVKTLADELDTDGNTSQQLTKALPALLALQSPLARRSVNTALDIIAAINPQAKPYVKQAKHYIGTVKSLVDTAKKVGLIGKPEKEKKPKGAPKPKTKKETKKAIKAREARERLAAQDGVAGPHNKGVAAQLKRDRKAAEYADWLDSLAYPESYRSKDGVSLVPIAPFRM